jgi:hypothetical protein
MTFATGRLRVLGSFSLSVRVEPNREKLRAKARAHAERALGPGSPQRMFRHRAWWRTDLEPLTVEATPHERLDSRTATLLAEREAVVRSLDGYSGFGRGKTSVRVPRWRWHKRRVLEREVCRRNHIEKWW